MYKSKFPYKSVLTASSNIETISAKDNSGLFP
nr:MAG TPA: hypothetical protein [Bacteriophage sp.]